MEFNEKIRQFIERITTLQASISTEEATKTSFVMPFFQLLGYDVFNPLEFVPEYIADVGIKKGEKIDYAIIVDENPLIFIECKSCSENLEKHGNQLFRYFGTTTAAKFAILTNGIVYRFYTDLENKNRMDDTPFLTIDLLNMKDRDFIELKKFTKDALDIDSILNTAEELKYNRLIKEWFSKELENPSPEFAKVILNEVYNGTKNQKVMDKFTPLIKRALQQHINDSMNTKIKSALSKENDEEIKTAEETILQDSAEEGIVRKIDTTIEELEAYAIVKSILRTTVNCERINYRDTESYFSILLDDNNRKWVCRIHLMQSIKYITVADENKKPVRYDINSIDDIYNYADEITESCKRYL
ncbi:type I restriction endonuclease [Clostridium aminobutyricum]|uniref:Type I restriction enzyme HsdR N-terminal domain-containing protein n=1 Tax=Clostridium aminobutyricum TaxID=33953 RepID=A0A939IIV9_CLOAM|nr:type I restriction endonuclease [Clostridium aminobutyricum]MBN7772963.1 type I restriction enzyme HsdR N-terminal domain-containing protein [Clostridium aminobutyricum]